MATSVEGFLVDVNSQQLTKTADDSVK